MDIYVLCPANIVTGGVELAHQMCHAINSLTDVRAKMWYIDIKNTTAENVVMDIPAPDEYAKYNTSCATDFKEIDKKENVIIFPEGITCYLPLIDNARIVMWWMSVDFYLLSGGKASYDQLRKRICFHLFQSYYAQEFVKEHIPEAEGMFLSDYINEEHGKFVYPADLRKDLAFYNPKKGRKEIEPLIAKTNWLKWVPLLALKREQVILLLQTGKIYVDFGEHPGKDRIPREAVANGCCVITNKKGAARYFEDVPIDDKYKFENPAESMDEIDALLHDICDNFADHQAKFADYREIIKNEKLHFDEDVVKFVERIRRSRNA